MIHVLQAIQEQHPGLLGIDDLEKICNQYPYFQSVRSIYLKKLFLDEHYKYNHQLKLVAAHTVDREILFDYINQITEHKLNTPPTIPKEEPIITPETIVSAENNDDITPSEVKVTSPETFEEINKNVLVATETDTIETSEILSEENTTPTTALSPVENTTIEPLEKPLLFTSDEKLSFNQWLQLTNTKVIQRTETTIAETPPEIQKKISIIDKFIQNNPKIEPVKKNAPVVNNQLDLNQEISTELMTETLAKVYISQKKYENAMQAYRILSLKYPEKSGYFADQIKQIRNLQNNKS